MMVNWRKIPRKTGRGICSTLLKSENRRAKPMESIIPPREGEIQELGYQSIIPGEKRQRMEKDTIQIGKELEKKCRYFIKNDFP